MNILDKFLAKIKLWRTFYISLVQQKLDEQCLSLKAKNYSLKDETQRRLWENIRDLRNVSEETFFIKNFRETSQRFANQPSLRCLWDAVRDVSDMHQRCIHARLVVITISDFKIFPIMLYTQLRFGTLLV